MMTKPRTTMEDLRLSFPFLGIFFLLLCGALPAEARADDGIFPAASMAKPFIDFDGRGFLVNGKRTFLVSGSLHYSRVPRALWRDRILRMKRAGFNTVQTYAFWNFHEPREGKWDFAGDKNLDAFLKLIHEMGMYAVVRPGPYVCAEWDSGGYPVWLRFKPGVRVREDNPEFEAVVDRWYEKVIPILAANQIHRGGAVLMVQLENEHPQGWGRDMPNGYFRHLREKAVSLGLEVPYFFSGLHHGNDPAGSQPWDSKGRANPWYTTEFWPGWYDLYGPLSTDRFRHFDRGTWKILAYGGNGYNFYMLHGGTDFDTWNNDEVASSYDYGGAIGQAGDLRPIYYRFKRAAWFARTFASILEDSENATDVYKGAVTSPAIRVTARKSLAGTLLFLDNNSNNLVGTQVRGEDGAVSPSEGSLLLLPGEIMPVVQNYKLLPEVTLQMAAARILGIVQQGDTTTLVIYGMPHRHLPDRPYVASITQLPEDRAEMRFEVPAEGVRILKGAPASMPADSALIHAETDPGHVVLKTGFSTTSPEEYVFAVGSHKVRILAVRDDLADRTWFLNEGDRSRILMGPWYVGEVAAKGEALRCMAENAMFGWTPAEVEGMTLYDEGAAPQHLHAVLPTSEALTATYKTPELSAWQMRRADAEAAPNYFASGWKFSIQPLPMGADGDNSAYSWYRVPVRVPKAGAYTLTFSDAGDWVAAFVNGQRAANSKIKQRFYAPVPRTLDVPLKAGENTLAIFAAHYGRHKLFNYLGPLDKIDAKGVAGPVTISAQVNRRVTVTKWRWKADDRGEAAAPEMTAPPLPNRGEDWQAASINDDVFHGRRGYVWFRTTLESVPGPHRRLHFEAVDDNATVYLNGKRLLHHEGWNTPFDVPLDTAWHEKGPNLLAVLVQNTDGPGGIMGAVDLAGGEEGGGLPIRGWRMRGGIGDPMGAGRSWQPVTGITGPGVPAFYRAEFTTTPPATLGAHPVLRVSLTGMSRGFVWLNGHNLGRYPEKVAVDGLWLPDCWLKPGKNTLVCFDEEGNSPASIQLVMEPAASRTVIEMTVP
jgi:beta-galactosidase